MNDRPSGSEEKSREALLKRKQQLEDRKLSKQLEILKIRVAIGELDEAEAALEQEKLFAQAADRLVNSYSFRESFCAAYRANRNAANRVEALAEIIVGLIQLSSPVWMGTPATPFALTSIAVLSATVISKKSADVYCNALG